MFVFINFCCAYNVYCSTDFSANCHTKKYKKLLKKYFFIKTYRKKTKTLKIWIYFIVTVENFSFHILLYLFYFFINYHVLKLKKRKKFIFSCSFVFGHDIVCNFFTFLAILLKICWKSVYLFYIIWKYFFWNFFINFYFFTNLNEM